MLQLHIIIQTISCSINLARSTQINQLPFMF